MRLIFAGTPEFAAAALAQLHEAGFDIPLVLTQPDRPAGRGLKLQASSVKQFALMHGMAVAQPRSLRLDGKYPEDARAAREAMLAVNADVMVVAAYGLILPQWVLEDMAPTLPAARGSLPPEGAHFTLGRPGGETMAPTLPAVRGSLDRPMPEATTLPAVPSREGGTGAAALSPEGAPFALGRPDGETVNPALPARKLGCLNIHASLLPRWRGAAPIHRAIEAGDGETGVTIMQMDAGLDTGDMLLIEKLPITPFETTASLHDKLAVLGARMIVQALGLLARDALQAVVQPTGGITYAHKIDKAEALVDWSQPVAVIERRIRAFNPFPVAVTQLGSEMIKLWRSCIDSSLTPSDRGCGTVLSANADGVRVVCGDGVLNLTELQRAGGKRLGAADFLRGFSLQAGQSFDLPSRDA